MPICIGQSEDGIGVVALDGSINNTQVIREQIDINDNMQNACLVWASSKFEIGCFGAYRSRLKYGDFCGEQLVSALFKLR